MFSLLRLGARSRIGFGHPRKPYSTSGNPQNANHSDPKKLKGRPRISVFLRLDLPLELRLGGDNFCGSTVNQPLIRRVVGRILPFFSVFGTFGRVEGAGPGIRRPDPGFLGFPGFGQFPGFELPRPIWTPLRRGPDLRVSGGWPDPWRTLDLDPPDRPPEAGRTPLRTPPDPPPDGLAGSLRGPPGGPLSRTRDPSPPSWPPGAPPGRDPRPGQTPLPGARALPNIGGTHDTQRPG